MIMRTMEHAHTWADMQNYLEGVQNIVGGSCNEAACQLLIDYVGMYHHEKTLHDLVLASQKASNPLRKVSDFRVVSLTSVGMAGSQFMPRIPST